MLHVKITENSDLMSKRLSKILKGMDEGVKETVYGVGMATRDLARASAPRDTGALILAIGFKESGIAGGWRSKVTLGFPARANWKGQYVPYGAMINDGSVLHNNPNWGRATGAYRKIGFFDRAYDYARTQFPKKLMARVRKEIRWN